MSTNTPAKRPLEPQKYAIVVGGSSGIGAAMVAELVGHGYRVATVARSADKLTALADRLNLPNQPARVLPFTHDVVNSAEVPALFQQIVSDLGGLDLIVYAAGIQHRVDANEYCFEKDAEMVQVNLLGAMAWLNEAAIRFEQARRGHIVGISSIAGDRGRVGAPGYNTSKAALNTYLEALRNRLSKRGVTVTTIKPGFVDTRLLENAPKTFWVISPEAASAEIYKHIVARTQQAYVPKRWALVGLIVRSIPSTIFRRMSF